MDDYLLVPYFISFSCNIKILWCKYYRLQCLSFKQFS